MRTLKLVLTLIIILFSVKSYSSHVVGYDMNIVHLTGDTYKVKVRLYRDVISSSVPLPTSITFDTYEKSSNVNVGLTITLPCVFLYLQTYDPSDCAPASANLSIQVGEYEYTLTAVQALSLSNPLGYYFSSNLCCRAASTNITESMSQGYNFTMDLPALSANSVFKYNSSPVFPSVPLTTFCVNKPTTLNWQCTDLDGDSLSYSLVPLWDGASAVKPFSTAPFAPGFNLYYNIMDGNPDISIHPITGDINFTATKIGKYYLMIKVNEFRKINGLEYLIGTTYREVLFSTIACVEEPPVISSIKLNNRVIRDTIPLSVYDSSYTYNRLFLGADYVADSIQMKIVPDAGILDNVFNKNAGFGEVGFIKYGSAGQHNEIIAMGTISGKFRWVVDSTMTRNTPYHFRVYLHDQTCPISLSDYVDVYLYAPKKNCVTIYRNVDVTGCDSAQDENGKWYYVSGHYWDVYTNSSGCEVITEYNVKLTETNITQDLQGCDSVLGPNNKYYYTSGLYIDTVNTVSCDTIFHSNVTIVNSPPNLTIVGSTIVTPKSMEQYFITPLPGTAVFWYVNNGSLISGNRYSATVEWGNHTDGSITAVELSINGCYTTNNLAVDILSLGINTQKADFNIFPNPATNKIWIDNKSSLKELSADIFDIQGSKIKSLYLLEANEIDISDLAKGIYFVRIEGNAYKIVKY